MLTLNQNSKGRGDNYKFSIITSQALDALNSQSEWIVNYGSHPMAKYASLFSSLKEVTKI